MKKSKNNPKWFKNDSIFFQLMVSTTMSYILLCVGAIFVFFLSPEGDPLNKGENGNGSWNLWVGVLIWVVMVLLYFFKDKLSEVDFDNDPVLNKLDDELDEINRNQLPKLQKIKDEQPENWKQLVEYGLVDPKDFKDENEELNNSDLGSLEKPEDKKK